MKRSEWSINPVNLVCIYLPVSLLIALSLWVNVYGIKRLNKGLEDTFSLRMAAIKDSLFYCLGYTAYFIVLGTCYFLVWNDDSQNNDATLSDENGAHYLYALTVAFLGLNDFGLWMYRQFVLFKKREESKKEDLKMANVHSLNAHVRGQKSFLQRNELTVGKNIIAPALPQHIAFMESNSDQHTKTASKCEQFCSRLSITPTVADQSINKALRREVLAYTTDGIAQSVDHQDKLTHYWYVTKATPKPMRLRDGLQETDYPHTIKDEHGRTLQRIGMVIKYNKHLLYESGDPLLDVDSEDEELPVVAAHADMADMEMQQMEQQSLKQENLVVPASPQNVPVRSDDEDDIDQDDNKAAAGVRPEYPVVNRMERVATKLVVGGGGAGGEKGIGVQREFVDFAPIVFKYIRNHICGISDHSYRASIIPKEKSAQRNVLDAKYGEGRSGAFFYFTHDSRYLVKTIKKFEVEVMLKTLREYVEHLKQNPNTVLSRVVGLHSIRLYGLTKYFVVTENVFLSSLKPSEVYDLKGSWVNRYSTYGVTSGKTLKDGDLKRFVVCNKHNRTQLIDQLNKDSLFLASCNIMDYSLLLGIYYLKMAPDKASADAGFGRANNGGDDEKYSHEKLNSYAGGMRAEIIEGPGLYYMGIIDTLQVYNFKKKLETFAKRYILRQDKNGMSCVHPDKYQTRFMNYMKNIIVTDDEYYKELKVAKKEFERQSMLIYPGKQAMDNSVAEAQNMHNGNL
eukprot:CAMPEP_0202708118 /NCGR_PEP_ID=MMETSP1385-20130828/20374_1 /ASSEMBLY_ACC=CAM_ASM_000861 /TAXON_ID=933848 /ORGANISM="Elphidium margaritaceum" /LENGTH=736 /DNA_ID=CAMNT_0049367015 /DNA_START=537 /DNA_END=2747 /DNA_ORIENTATION=-